MFVATCTNFITAVMDLPHPLYKLVVLVVPTRVPPDRDHLLAEAVPPLPPRAHVFETVSAHALEMVCYVAQLSDQEDCVGEPWPADWSHPTRLLSVDLILKGVTATAVCPSRSQWVTS